MRKLSVSLLLAMVSLAAVAQIVTVDPERAEVARKKRTMADIRMLGVALEAYAADHKSYPDGRGVKDLEPFLTPDYLPHLPITDAWGTPLAYRVDSHHQSYRLASAGTDRTFDPSSLDISKKPDKSDDIVYQDGKFLQAPYKWDP